MSKKEALVKTVKHVEEEIEAIFAGDRRGKAADAAGSRRHKGEKAGRPAMEASEDGGKAPESEQAARGGAAGGHDAEYTIETENLAVPEIHTGRAEHKKAHCEADGGKAVKKGKGAKPSIQYDTLAVPEIHMPHGDK